LRVETRTFEVNRLQFEELFKISWHEFPRSPCRANFSTSGRAKAFCGQT
jgi:hypothetical protein